MRTHAFLIGCLAGFSTASSYALDYPLSPRMGATVIKIDNIDSSKASAIGQVMRPDAEEYCNRDPNGDRRAAGLQQKCVNELLKDLGGRQYLATANCTQKKVTTRNETYVVKKQ